MANWDAAWFDQLYKEHHKTLKSAVWHLVKDDALAEDIVHETFLNLLNKASELRGHPNISGWLFTVAQKIVKNEIRRAHRHRELPMLEEAIGLIYEHKERLDEILPEDMPPGEREVLIWLYEEQLDISEIAQRLNIPEVTVRSKAFRGRQNYKKFLKKLKTAQQNAVQNTYIDKEV